MSLLSSVLLTIDIDRAIDQKYVNPNISITEYLKGSEIEFPDPTVSYFVSSQISENYKLEGNDSILINSYKNHFESQFNLTLSNTLIKKISNNLFSGARPIEGLAKKALELAMKECAKSSPTLPNRL